MKNSWLWIGVMLFLTTGATSWAGDTPDTVEPTSTTRLIILGSAGGPVVRKFRSQPAALISVGGRNYLVDCGDGTSRQLALVGVKLSEISTVFLTHLHFDHTAGLAPLLAYRWISLSRGPLEIYGPPGTQELVRTGIAAFAISERLFAAETPSLPTMASLAISHEIDIGVPSKVYEDDRVRVTAVENTHYITLHLPAQSYGRVESYAYRFDTRDRSIVFTGDTGPSDAVARLAKGADVLVSEVLSLPQVLAFLHHTGASDAQLKPLVEHMRREHLSPEEVGKLASKAGVKMVVLTHFLMGADEELDPTIYTAGVKKFYSGPVIASRDLQEF